jgi:hypothetical protein
MLAPFNIQINSTAAEGTKRSSEAKLNIFPKKDFLETDMQIGIEKI